MGIPLFQVDAFAAKAFTGNPAAVCFLEEEAEPEWMQSVAAEMNLSETAFVMPSGAMTLREVERQVVLGVLDKHGGDKRMAAEELGIALKTMYNKLNQYNASAVDESSEIVSTD